MKSIYPITATFIDQISHYMVDENWTLDEWRKEFDYMQEVGIDTLVIIRGGYDKRMVYPSKYLPHITEEIEDFAEFIFAEADRRDMNVFTGLYLTKLCIDDTEAEIEKNKLFVSEVLERYNHHKSFFGWYLSYESEADYDGKLITMMNGLSSLCKEKSPEKKVFISPFFANIAAGPVRKELTPEETYHEWKRVLKDCYQNIDICAFQDGTVRFWEYEEYLKAVKRFCDDYNITLWTNVETFDRDPRWSCLPIQFEVLREKLRIANKYAEKNITFCFSRFLSPQSVFQSGRNLNKRYREYYEKKNKEQK